MESSTVTIETVLKFVAVPSYAFGFFTILFHTASFGLPVIQVIDPLNFWVGMLPTIVLLASWYLIKFLNRFPPHSLSNFVVKKVGTGVTVGIILFLSAASIYCITKGTHRPLFSPGNVSFWVPINPIDGLYSIGGLALAAVASSIALGLKREGENSLHPGPGPILLFKSVALFTVSYSVIIIFTLYVIQIYPRLPQRYGFGNPSQVRLVVNSQMVSPEELPGVSFGTQLCRCEFAQ
jgi:hypothetical protein